MCKRGHLTNTHCGRLSRRGADKQGNDPVERRVLPTPGGQEAEQRLTVVWLAERPLFGSSLSTLRKGRHNKATNFYNTIDLSSQASQHRDNFPLIPGTGTDPFCCRPVSRQPSQLRQGVCHVHPRKPGLFPHFPHSNGCAFLLKLFSR